MENNARPETGTRTIGAIVSDATWEAIAPAVVSSRLPVHAVERISRNEEIPQHVKALVVDLHAYARLLDLAMAYRKFMRRTLFVAWTAEEELGLLEFIDPADDIVRADAVGRQLPLRVERLLSETRMTRMDLLTGLSNRRALALIADQAFREGVDPDHPLSEINIDLDHFKRINDTYGHQAGDDVLRAAASAIRASCPEAICACRSGGEEFVVLLHADRGLARSRAEDIRDRIGAAAVGDGIRFTASIGVATDLSPAAGFQGLFDRADRCLYQAKHSGRNRVVDEVDFAKNAQDNEEDPLIVDFDNRVRVLTDRLADYLSQKGRAMARGFQDEADLDGLTGIYNRRYFDRRIERELENSRKPGQPLSMILFDIDDFGAVNRNYGFPAGDRCLKAVTAALARSVRNTDWVARYGGEELCAILPGTSLEEAADIAERILEAIRALRATAVDGRVFGVTASCGVVETRGDDPDVPAFVQRASDKVRQAKKAGKNQAAR